MHADLEHLVVLQAQDLELRRLRAELTEAPRRGAKAQNARAEAEVALTATQRSLAAEETLRRGHELEVASQQSKLTRLRKQMETATSAAQITALEHEISFGTATISRLEDEELASLERSEELESRRITGTQQLAELTQALAAERARMAAMTTTHNASIEGIEKERSELREKVAATDAGASLLSAYDRIAKAKGTAISEASDQRCSACQMMVRPQRWNDLTNRDPHGEHAGEIFTCETCGRMLFYDPRRDAPVRWTPGERLQKATPAT
jgi:predicted  nucleic acid-binding Zn-ribbon protein